MQVGHRLRQLFTTILIFCQPSRPRALWEEFCHSICDDLRRKLQSLGVTHPTDEEIYDYGLH
ncbi:hypothetical protein C8J56DRAFT_762993, partial [Mycena floridula]